MTDRTANNNATWFDIYGSYRYLTARNLSERICLGLVNVSDFLHNFDIFTMTDVYLDTVIIGRRLGCCRLHYPYDVVKCNEIFHVHHCNRVFDPSMFNK